MVYELYELSDEEINIIENEINQKENMTKEQSG